MTQSSKSEYASSLNFAAQSHLVPLVTKGEVEARLHTIEAFVIEIPIRSASSIVKIIDAAIPQDSTTRLHHLRRFVKPPDLPRNLQCLDTTHAGYNSYTNPAQSTNTDLSYSISPEQIASNCVKSQELFSPPRAQVLHFLVCPKSAISYPALHELLIPSQLWSDGKINSTVRVVVVPQFPPTSEEQAKQLSQRYWPTTYKGGNPFGPHPTIVAHAMKELQRDAAKYMDLAARAGQTSAAERLGESVGAAVIDRSQGKSAVIVAVGGDARWKAVSAGREHGFCNPMAHAVMRVIGMVARKRLLLDDQRRHHDSIDVTSWFADIPLTTLEKDVYTESTLAPGGYLCLDMELYVTHEPCVMCSMAINHSRFGRVIFGKHMPDTGGLTVEDRSNSAYGLFWRPELNWKFLCWLYVSDAIARTGTEDISIHA